jgi:hypothetical protein
MSRSVGPETVKEPSIRSPEFNVTGMEVYCPACRLIFCVVVDLTNAQLPLRVVFSNNEIPQSKILHFVNFIYLPYIFQFKDIFQDYTMVLI